MTRRHLTSAEVLAGAVVTEKFSDAEWDAMRIKSVVLAGQALAHSAWTAEIEAVRMPLETTHAD